MNRRKGIMDWHIMRILFMWLLQRKKVKQSLEVSKHIDHIEITNFKSIRHQKIEGCKRINVFIGYPNVGKSNILEAMSLFSLPYLKIAGIKKLAVFIWLKNLPGLFYGTDTKTPIEININDQDLRFTGNYDKNAFYPLDCIYLNGRS